MRVSKTLQGHLLALFTVIVWGVTYISIKILLDVISPTSIMFLRFLIAYFSLLVFYPHFAKPTSFKEEFFYFLAGLTGSTLYQLSQNISLNYSTASNTGLIVSSAPIFTALAFHIFSKEEKITKNFILGFCVAIFGIFLVIFNGQINLKLNPLGDFLALMSAICWAIYSVVLKNINNNKYNILYSTRKIFFYAIITSIPFLFIFKIDTDFSVLLRADIIFHLLFLGIFASGICYATWSMSTKILGGIKTSTYIYLIPFITLVTSIFILHEKITFITISGSIFILVGLYISGKEK